MLFNKYSDMTKELHHTTYLQPYASGIYYLRYTGASSPLPSYLSGDIDSSIADLIVENKYFILENIINDGMLLQRITLNKSNDIYFRTGKLSSKIVSGFMTRHTINGWDFTDWIREYIKENDPNVVAVLQNSSKESMREKFVSRTEPTVDTLFKYQYRITNIDDLDNARTTGFCSVIEPDVEKLRMLTGISNLDDLMTYYKNDALGDKDDYLKGLNPDKHLEMVYKYPKNARYHSNPNLSYKVIEGVVEVFSTDNYILQSFYISSPIITNINRYLDKRYGQWSSWRRFQTVDDVFLHACASPHTNHSDWPIPIRKFQIAPLNLIYPYRGYVDNTALSSTVTSFASNKLNVLNKLQSEIYPIRHKYGYNFTHGYISPNSIHIAENGTITINKVIDDILINFGLGSRTTTTWNNDPYNVNTIYTKLKSNLGWSVFPTDGLASSQLVSLQNKTWAKLPTEEVIEGGTYPINVPYRFTQDALQGYGNYSYIYQSSALYSYINGFSLYWTTNNLYFDVIKKELSLVPNLGNLG